MKVMVAVWNPSGAQRAILTYDAPDDSQVGDSGKVELWVREQRQAFTFDATITSLTSDYSGPCKRFVRSHPVRPAEQPSEPGR
jgi:hypothetical protein